MGSYHIFHEDESQRNGKLTSPWKGPEGHEGTKIAWGDEKALGRKINSSRWIPCWSRESRGRRIENPRSNPKGRRPQTYVEHSEPYPNVRGAPRPEPKPLRRPSSPTSAGQSTLFTSNFFPLHRKKIYLTLAPHISRANSTHLF